MRKDRSKTETEVPLHLLPPVIARRIREWGDAVYSISVRRTHWHHYNVTVRTKRIPRELATVQVAVLYVLPGTGAPKKHRAARKGRRCVA
jgi:hypothetical protein